MEETVMVGNGTREYVPQSSGRFYDLLPDGMHVDTRSVAVQTEEGYLAENSYSVSVTSNYKDSGRDLLVVDIDEEAQYYNLYFTTRTDWNSIKDFGTEIYNPAAYETGNDNIKYGTIDDGGSIAESDKALMTGLDADCTTRIFIYTGERCDIAALTAATAGLTKHIKEAKDALYTTKTETTPNGEYSYRLRYMNTIRTKAKDLIFYDSLENYKINGETVDGDPLSEEYTSDWHGTLTGVDVSQMVATGAKPVIYLSRTANLVFLNNDVGDLPDLSDTSVWQTMDQFGDISEAKAIAIDLRKKADGSDFVLDRGESAIAILQMKAPAGASSSYTRVPVSFNNIYISDTVIDLFDNEIEKYIHHDYTQIQFVVKGDITIHKKSDKDENPIKGIKFRLRGTSDYGDEIDTFASSNRKGLLTFANIPKGTYILSEYEGIPDYQEDHTEMAVQIDDTGKVWFTDKNGTRIEITDSQAEITNKPRIHADVHIIKRDNARKGTVIPNVAFKLSGISDYGNDVVMVATTDEDGKLVFENLEQGTYELIELEAPEGYINDGRKYEVTVDQNGNVSVTGAEIEE